MTINTPRIRTSWIDTLRTDNPQIGVILAGGKSSRMGVDKAGLTLGTETLLMRARRVLQEAGCECVILSGAARLDWSHKDALTVPDIFPHAGPVGGMVSVLRWCRNEMMKNETATTASDENPVPPCFVFIPVDTPRLPPALLATLRLSSGRDGCALLQDGQPVPEPLPICLRSTPPVWRQCELANKDLSTGKHWSVKRFIEPLTLHTIAVTVADTAQLVNVNTPADWQAIIKNQP